MVAAAGGVPSLKERRHQLPMPPQSETSICVVSQQSSWVRAYRTVPQPLFWTFRLLQLFIFAPFLVPPVGLDTSPHEPEIFSLANVPIPPQGA